MACRWWPAPRLPLPARCTLIMMAAITALFGVLGAAMGGKSGMLLALGFALLSNFFAYWFSDKMVLRMYNAQEVDAQSAPHFYAMVAELAQRQRPGYYGKDLGPMPPPSRWAPTSSGSTTSPRTATVWSASRSKAPAPSGCSRR